MPEYGSMISLYSVEWWQRLIVGEQVPLSYADSYEV